jgi:hypothetical protein
VEHALIFFQQVEVSIFPFQLQSGPDEGEARVNNIHLLSNLIQYSSPPALSEEDYAGEPPNFLPSSII